MKYKRIIPILFILCLFIKINYINNSNSNGIVYSDKTEDQLEEKYE